MIKEFIKKQFRKFFLWLFKEQFQEVEKRCKDLDNAIHKQEYAALEAKIHSERIHKLIGNIDVSVDVNPYSGSWAIISLQGGKTDYIKFVSLDDWDLVEIAKFLRQYDRTNVKVDASPSDRHILNEQIYRI